MLSAEKFKVVPSRAELNQTEPSQSIAADRDGPSQVTLEGEGTEFLERVCNCADREDAVVRALKELNMAKAYITRNGEKRMAWYSIEVESMSPGWSTQT